MTCHRATNLHDDLLETRIPLRLASNMSSYFQNRTLENVAHGAALGGALGVSLGAAEVTLLCHTLSAQESTSLQQRICDLANRQLDHLKLGRVHSSASTRQDAGPKITADALTWTCASAGSVYGTYDAYANRVCSISCAHTF